jgi:branched-chain amino acid transport system substrate-binding protein
MRRPTRRSFVPFAAVTAVTALVAAGCGSTSASSSASSTAQPIKIGISLPLTGQFQADGLATENGYKLWASDVNIHGGLLGRPVRLVLRDDKSNPKTVSSDYNVLINQDHVDLTLAPYSTLLSINAAQVTHKYGYALLGGSAAGPAMYALNFRNFFCTTVPVKNQMKPFATWVLSLPPALRQTAAYPEVDDPFADPPVDSTQATLSHAGVKTVYQNHAAPATTPAQIKTAATRVAQKHPEIVVVGSVDLPSLLLFIHTWQRMGYTPKIMIAASGPDQGQAFLNKLNPANAQAIMVPNGWYGQEANALSHVMVENYIAKFGGTSSDINADVAEAYSAGEVLADAVTATRSTSNKGIIAYLHSHTMQTVQGPTQFDQKGENILGQDFIFQWNGGQFNQVLGPRSTTTAPIVRTKLPWQSS